MSVSRRPSEWVTTVAASGPAKARRSSASPAGSTASISRSTSTATSSVKRSRTACRRNGRANGARWRWCSSPSSVSMLGPTTRPVEKRGSSTVNVAASPMTCSARSRRRTSQPPSAGSHDDRRALAQAGEQRMSVRRRQGLDGDSDLLVIGGGVMGLFTAYHASERFGRVVVLERGRIGDPMTASFGRTRSFRNDYLDATYARLAHEAFRLWGEFEPQTAHAGARPLRLPEHRQALGHPRPRRHLRADEPRDADAPGPAHGVASTATALRERFPLPRRRHRPPRRRRRRRRPARRDRAR